MIVSDPLRNAPTAKMPTAEDNDVLVPYRFFLPFLLAYDYGCVDALGSPQAMDTAMFVRHEGRSPQSFAPPPATAIRFCYIWHRTMTKTRLSTKTLSSS